MTSENQLSALERLADLRSRGMLTEAQYETQKARVFDSPARSTRPYIIAALGGLVVFVAMVIGLSLRPSASLVQPASLPSPSAQKLPLPSYTPAPTSSPTVTPSSEPDLPSGRGKASVADPIAQSPSQTSGMKPDKVLRVAAKRVVLFKREGEGVFDASYVLMVGGHGEVLEDGQLYSISAVGPYVILQVDSGGTACPALFRIVDVVAGRITETFGTCSDLIRTRVASDGSLIAVVHRFNVGGPVTAKYSRGTLTTWGEI